MHWRGVCRGRMNIYHIQLFMDIECDPPNIICLGFSRISRVNALEFFDFTGKIQNITSKHALERILPKSKLYIMMQTNLIVVTIW